MAPVSAAHLLCISWVCGFLRIFKPCCGPPLPWRIFVHFWSPAGAAPFPLLNLNVLGSCGGSPWLIFCSVAHFVSHFWALRGRPPLAWLSCYVFLDPAGAALLPWCILLLFLLAPLGAWCF